MGCASSQPEVTLQQFTNLQTRLASVEEKLEEKNVESATYQQQLLAKALEETTDTAATELGQLRTLLEGIRGMKSVMEDMSNVKAEGQDLLPVVAMNEDEDYTITKVSLVVFHCVGSCGVTITQESGNKYSLDNMIDYRNVRMGNCALVHPGDSVKFKSFDPPTASAFIVSLNL